jgi:hypothetical protein
MSTKRILELAWLVSCVAAVTWWYVTYGIRSDLGGALKAESQIYLIAIMVVITFPIGLVWAYAAGLITYELEAAGIGTATAWHLDVLLWWFGFVVVGYVQWFNLIPRIVGAIRTWGSRRG